ncbi:GNAT family N-acetyltransferase [Psychroflexus sp. S27]|nr:GNAT family N-acetyltransferase [Psychroflexus sp. S27]
MMEYTLAKSDEDLEGILSLQKANLKKNLTPKEIELEGYVTVDHDWEILKSLNEIEPHVIAKDGNKIVGYVLTMTGKSRYDIPLIYPMFNEFDKLIFKGQSISEYKYMVVGQACIYKDYRGKGLVEKCFQLYKETYSQFYDFSITEIDRINKRSLNAHLKIGYQVIHSYKDNDKDWDVVLWDWNK